MTVNELKRGVGVRLREELAEQLRARLNRSGITLDSKLQPEEVMIRYFDFKHRTPPQKIRKVFLSKELEGAQLSADLQRGLAAIQDAITSGSDLGPFFSKTWLKLDLHDSLFNDWGIRHMHLGSPERDPRDSDFVKRTESVLYVFLDSEAAYLIDVDGHGLAFANEQRVNILHRNWPHLIAHARCEGFSIAPFDRIDAANRSRRRKGLHFNSLVSVDDGTVYGNIGGGHQCDGRSTCAVELTMALQNFITDEVASSLDGLDHSDATKQVFKILHYVKPGPECKEIEDFVFIHVGV